MPKLKYILFFFLIASDFAYPEEIFPEREKAGGVLSEEREKILSGEEEAEIRDTLVSLMILEKKRAKNRDEVSRWEAEFSLKGESMEEKGNKVLDKETRRMRGLSTGWKKIIGNKKNTSYIKELFRNIETLSSWIEKNPYMLYLSLRFENRELAEFFAENGSMGPQDPLVPNPLFFSIITQDIEAIKFFFRHPKTDWEAVNVWEDNLFHGVLLSFSPHYKEVLNLLFHEDYFPKISHLLNKPNKFGETVFDLALKELENAMFFEKNRMKRVVELLSKNGALPSEAHRGIEEKSDPEMERFMAILERRKKELEKINSNRDEAYHKEEEGESKSFQPVMLPIPFDRDRAKNLDSRQNKANRRRRHSETPAVVQTQADTGVRKRNSKNPGEGLGRSKEPNGYGNHQREIELKGKLDHLEEQVDEFILGEKSGGDFVADLFEQIRSLGSQIITAEHQIFLRRHGELVRQLENAILQQSGGSQSSSKGPCQSAVENKKPLV